MAKIHSTDTLPEVVAKMANGNIGAVNVLMEIVKNGHTIDASDPVQGIGAILMLDKLGIYGSDIYVLHNDICERNLAKTLAVIYSTQLGMFNGSLLAEACSRQDRSGRELVPVDKLFLQVQERLPNFASEV